ncbi:unnamed protein product [Gemmata massiliana]|uniref:Uncharacterized protein n=1 Tax=Gemmata massiliana TaxID=1210884 RepID=A0A6P2CZ63_9BACT|nr:hypothetical protein [Gemmata massiliana]VTR94271.1 unnamed protein product [Gemmata massiliana]
MPAKWLLALLACVLVRPASGADDPPPAQETKPPEGWVSYAPKDKVFNVWIPKGGKRTERGDWVDVKDIRARVNILELESNDQGNFIVRTILIQPGPPKLNPLPPLGVPGAGALPPPPILPIQPIKPMKPVVPGKLPPPVIGVPPAIGVPAAPAMPAAPQRPLIGPDVSQAMIEAARNSFLKEVKGKVADEKEIKLEKLTGKEYEITIDAQKSARLRVFAIGTFVHYFAIVGTKEQVEGKDADTFLDSFKITIGKK